MEVSVHHHFKTLLSRAAPCGKHLFFCFFHSIYTILYHAQWFAGTRRPRRITSAFFCPSLRWQCVNSIWSNDFLATACWQKVGQRRARAWCVCSLISAKPHTAMIPHLASIFALVAAHLHTETNLPGVRETEKKVHGSGYISPSISLDSQMGRAAGREWWKGNFVPLPVP